MDGILFSDGETPLVEEWINPCFGYQAVHLVTGRILPTCQRFEIFSWNAIIEKINEVYEYLDVDTTEYYIEPIYESELDEINGYIFRMSNIDFLGL